MTVTERIVWFSKLWKHASNVFPYFDQKTVNFDQAYADYLPRVMTADSDREYCLILAEFINLLGDGHTDFTFPKVLRDEVGYLPFSLIYIDDSYYIYSGDERFGQFLWAKVLSINDEPMDALLHRAFQYIYHVGNYAYPSKLHAILPFLLKKKDNRMETSAGMFRFDLAAAPPLDEAPELTTHIPFSPIPTDALTVRLYEGDMLYVRIPDLLHSDTADKIAEAIKSYRDLKGVILDLRENVGGMSAHGVRIAQLFRSGSFPGCLKHTRTMRGLDISSASQYEGMSEESIERYINDGLCDRAEVERCRKISANALFEEYQQQFSSEDHRALYDGPCVVLTSRNTISAAEDMVAMFLGRATILGTPTHGSTGTPFLLPLPMGGGARICSVGYRLSDGTEFITLGIRPDKYVENSIDDLRQGFDRVLSDALSLPGQV